ncbi:hypothetical protein ACIPPN_30785 [Streptomyces diastaticus]|uniref:hypothetical protein n=1 Tax=Streptomyces diastaticus TaxID=1956 RepID=UPI00342FF672
MSTTPTSDAEVKLDRLLHQRTGGMIGALSHQIRGSTLDAALTGTEQITQDSLEAVPLDVAAEAPRLLTDARNSRLPGRPSAPHQRKCPTLMCRH